MRWGGRWVGGSRSVVVDADGLSGYLTLPVLALELRGANPEPPGRKPLT